MFKLSNPFKSKTVEKIKSVIEAVITADAFDGFFNSFATSSKDFGLVPVYASIKIISQTIAISPLKLYQDTDKGRKNLNTHYLTRLLKNPYGYMTYFNWMQFMALNVAGRGNGYALIVRDDNYQVTELVPLKWDVVGIVEFINSNDFLYQINYAGKTIQVWHENILHFQIMSEDGKRGLNPIELHRKTLDSYSNEGTYSENFYKQATNISGVIEYPKRLDVAAIEQIKTGFGEKYGGVENTGKTAVISDGGVYKQLQLISPMDANYVESAKLTRADIAVIFGVPLNKLGDLSQATYSNISEMNRDFYKSTLAPYFIAIAQEMSNKLLSETEKDSISFDFDLDILLSLNKSERYTNYASGIRNGHITRNEVRRAEKLEEIDGLDEILQESGVLTKSQADANFNNSKGGNDANSNTDDDENDGEEIRALVKIQNDFKAELGRLKLQLNSSNKVTPKEEVK